MFEGRPSCCVPDSAGSVKKLTLPDGFRIGIVGLDNILNEVNGLNLVDAEAVREELIKKVAAHNYIPSDKETDYSAALLQEYKRKFGGLK